MAGEIDVPEPPELPPLESRAAMLAVALITIASLTSTWCAFQSALWDGRQAFAIMDGLDHNVRSTEAHIEGNQRMLLDVSTFVAWNEAQLRDDARGSAFYEARFRPELRAAFDAWREAVARDPSAAPSSPFVMPEYSRHEWSRGEGLARDAHASTLEAMRYNRTSDDYGLMTVLFAMTTILAGLADKLRDRRGREVLLGLATLILAGSLLRVATMPVAWMG
ncbi:hypothetical protein [Sandaracinus amylolyticus]|uniref:hypothetical protein n=1 Tax=Sandaracinus amylolyticus TaxID=927083 RepID=UPI001F43CA68|nr:hypothetical protein [Sandaracinus amylolyticus]UJR80631.1 Hypothetical protein I5071_26800 [Sandaracinus amylolyticus]